MHVLRLLVGARAGGDGNTKAGITPVPCGHRPQRPHAQRRTGAELHQARAAGRAAGRDRKHNQAAGGAATSRRRTGQECNAVHVEGLGMSATHLGHLCSVAARGPSCRPCDGCRTALSASDESCRVTSPRAPDVLACWGYIVTHHSVRGACRCRCRVDALRRCGLDMH